MTHEEAIALVASFNDSITRKDLDGLSRLMSPEHVFVDSAGNKVVGRDACLSAWKSFFSSFGDYRNVFERCVVTGDTVAACGHSLCSDERLAGPALWTATLADGQIVAWHVFDDNDRNRARIGV